MGLFDAFSADDESRSLWQSDRKFQKRASAASDDIDEYYGQGGQALRAAGPKAINALNSGVNEAIDRSSSLYDKAARPWNPLYDRGLQGLDSYWDKLQDPDSIFDSELYRAREAAGLDQINRGYNARGMLASGNNTQDQIDYMRQGGLDYYKMIMGLHDPYFGMAQNAAQGISSVRAGQAHNTMNLFDQLGANKSNVITGLTGQYANLLGDQGRSLAEINLERGRSSRDTGVQVANAESAAKANRWGAIMGGLQGLVGLI